MAFINFATFGTSCDELIRSYRWGLEQLGHQTHQSFGCVHQDAINAVLIAHGLQWSQLEHAAPRLINFNVEQMGGSRYQDPALGPRYFGIMRNLPNWDYSRRNINELQEWGISDITHVPLGHSPALETISPETKDIDVLFYGSINERRRSLIRQLRERGLNVVCSFDSPTAHWTAAERDGYIARSKLVLNVGFFEHIHILEEVRISYLLNNRVAVVSEMRPDTFAEDDMRQCVAGAPLEQLPDLCEQLCRNDSERLALAERGYDIFKARPWLPQLAAAVEQYLANNPTPPSRAIKRDTPAPAQINIGSGQRWRYDCLNLDTSTTYGADLAIDLNAPFPFERALHSWRFGRLWLKKAQFSHIRAEHVLEYATDPVQCMSNFLDLLQDHGSVELVVPYDLSFARSRDPRILRSFNEHSWDIYGAECWKLGWHDWRFELVNTVFILGEHGQKLASQGVSLQDISKLPRGVEAIKVHLRKRALSEHEKHLASAHTRKVV